MKSFSLSYLIRQCLILGGSVVLMSTIQASSKPSFPIDNSYTVKGSFLRYKQEFPQISLPEIKQDSQLKQQLEVVYSQHGERQLHLDIYSPKGSVKSQAVLLIHGGGWSSGNKSHLQPLAKALALKGYVSATIEYRRTPEAPFPASLIDIQEAITWYKSHASEYGFQADKIAILGASSGGHLAALIGFSAAHKQYAATESDYQVNAVIDLDGVLNVASGEGLEAENKNGDSQSALGRWLQGNFAEQTARWQSVSVPQYVGKQSPPLLFLSSGQSRFRAGFDDVAKRLSDVGQKAELKDFGPAPHTFWLFEPWFDDVVVAIDQFLQGIETQ